MNRTNLLLITTDQQRFDTIHRGGNPCIMTPHLDWLADTGVLFRRAYSDAPICCAARATMITGKHYRNLGDYGNWGQPSVPDLQATLPSILTRCGYQTRAIGKMHYHPARCNYGFEHMEILEDYYRFMRQFPERGIPMDHGVGQNEMEPAISTVPESWSLTRWTVNRAIDFLETRDSTRPFFLNVGFAKPHPPFDPCLSYWQLYDGMQLPPPVRGDWSKDPAAIHPAFLGPTRKLSSADRLSDAVLAQAKRAYYACITQIDYNLGHLFARLRELRLLDNTLIVFTSDHGEMMGDHHLSSKSVFLEGSCHVPMIMRAPQQLLPETYHGTQQDHLVSLADLMPTFLAAAGVPAAQNPPMDGADLLASVTSQAPARQQFIGAYEDHYCIIDGQWKYHYSHTGGAELLFNLEQDPMETRNLAASPELRETRQRLRAALAKALAASGKPAGADSGELKILGETPRDRRQQNANRWPGHHSRDYTPSDVLH
jgi:arylsulfatase A-like enzyme